jgi:predicted O-methyltransferase YrrM
MENNFTRADKVLLEMEEEAKKSFLPIVGPEKGVIITDVINRLKPKRTLEIGTLLGYSTILIGKNLSSKAEIVTIEIDKAEAEIAAEKLGQAGILPDVKIFIGDARKILPTIKGVFDLVFLDAVKEENLEYLELIDQKLRKGSVVIADNAGLFEQEMKEYLRCVRYSGKYESKYFPCGQDGLEISVRL